MNSIKKRAFSLIESAITLGVIGLLGGGIWLAASAVMLNMQANEVAKGIMVMADRTQNLIPIDPSGNSTWVTISSSAINMGIPPTDWVQNGTIKSPWGRVAIALRPASRIEIYIYGLNEERCRKLLGAITVKDGSGLISGVWNDDKAQQTIVLPFSYTHSICNPPITVLNFYVPLIRR